MKYQKENKTLNIYAEIIYILFYAIENWTHNPFQISFQLQTLKKNKEKSSINCETKHNAFRVL